MSSNYKFRHGIQLFWAESHGQLYPSQAQNEKEKKHTSLSQSLPPLFCDLRMHLKQAPWYYKVGMRLGLVKSRLECDQTTETQTLIVLVLLLHSHLLAFYLFLNIWILSNLIGSIFLILHVILHHLYYFLYIFKNKLRIITF